MSGKLVLLKTILKLTNWFKYKKRASLSRVILALDKITGDSVTVLVILWEEICCVIAVDNGGNGYVM